jgi:hypothetical protein
VQLKLFWELLNSPAGQGVQLLAFAPLYVPGEHNRQILADKPLYVPASQFKQLFPSVEYVPASQELQTVFADELIVPSGHWVQFVGPICLPVVDDVDFPELTFPSWQGVQVDEPGVELNVPSEQGKHLSILIDPFRLLYVPGSHAIGTEVPVGQ